MENGSIELGVILRRSSWECAVVQREVVGIVATDRGIPLSLPTKSARGKDFESDNEVNLLI